MIQDRTTTRHNRRVFAMLYLSAIVGFWTVIMLVSAPIEYAFALFLPFGWICELLLETRWPIDLLRRARRKHGYEVARNLRSRANVTAGVGVLIGVASISIGNGRGIGPVVVGVVAMIAALAVWWSLRRHRSGAGGEGAAEPGP